jgi:predicted SprT family Zn-dependent metalloprotease
MSTATITPFRAARVPHIHAERLAPIAQVARELMDEYGLTGWTFAWDSCTNSFGKCRYDSRTITLSWKLTARRLMHGEDVDVLDTIAHEIAHALVGAAAGHGPEWRAMALDLGVDKDKVACYGQYRERAANLFRARCSCGAVFLRRRRINTCCGVCPQARRLRWERIDANEWDAEVDRLTA